MNWSLFGWVRRPHYAEISPFRDRSEAVALGKAGRGLVDTRLPVGSGDDGLFVGA
jgi:hypothetical protein